MRNDQENVTYIVQAKTLQVVYCKRNKTTLNHLLKSKKKKKNANTGHV